MSNVETNEGDLLQLKEDKPILDHINKKIKFEDMKKDNFQNQIDL
jgi:hypothetical protein